MEQLDGFKREKLTIDLMWANVLGLLIMIPIFLLFGLPYYFLWMNGINLKEVINEIFFDDVKYSGIYMFLLLIIGIVVHELIHGIVWSIFAKNGFKSIKFGVLWKMLTPYCHCKEPLKTKHYILGAMAPAIVLGIVPSVIAIAYGHLGLLVFGMFFTLAATGDFLIINLIRKENMDDLVQDHPSEAGCYIYRKNDNSQVPEVEV